MSGIKVLKLSEVCRVYQPETISKRSLPKNGVFPVYGANGKIGFNDKFNHEDPQLLLGCRGSVGSIHISEPFSWINGNAMVVQPFEEVVVRDYLKYAFLGGIDLEDAISGTAQPQITRESLSPILIPIPSLKEQQEIVQNLDDAFSQIDSLEVNLKLIDEKFKLLLQSVFNSEFSKAGVVFEPLEKLVEILDSQRVPINATERLKRIGDVPYYGATGQVGTIDKAIFNETLILLGEDGVPFFDPAKHKAYEISGPSWVNNHAHVLRAKSQHIVQRYLLHFLNEFNYSGFVNGATRLKLTQGDMKRIPVPLPSLELQHEIVKTLDNACSGVETSRNLIAEKQGLVLSLRQSIVRTTFTRMAEGC